MTIWWILSGVWALWVFIRLEMMIENQRVIIQNQKVLGKRINILVEREQIK